MNNKIRKTIYYVGTALLTGVMCFSVQMYFRNTDMVRGYFTSLSYPSYLVIPLAIAKILGLIAIWSNLNRSLKEWAYAGFFFNIAMAFTAHQVAGGGAMFSIIAMVGLMLSYIGWDKKDRFHQEVVSS